MNVNQPIITIIVPVRNRAHMVVKTLDSIARQSYSDFKLIIVDNDSSDNTLEVIQQWAIDHASAPFDITILSENAPGACAARNCGLKHTDTPYVMFFDSDDIMLPGHLSRLAQSIAQFPDADIFHWDIGIMDSDGWLQVKSPRFHDPMQLHLLHSTLGTQRFAIKAEQLRQCGGWDESLPAWNDLELGSRLLAINPQPAIKKIHGEPTVIVYPQTDSITGNDYNSRAEYHHLALDKIMHDVAPLGEPLYNLTVRAKMAITAGLYRKEGDKTQAKRMFVKATDNIDFHARQVLKAIYHSVRLTGRGGAAIALAFFGKKAPKC